MDECVSSQILCIRFIYLQILSFPGFLTLRFLILIPFAVTGQILLLVTGSAEAFERRQNIVEIKGDEI